MIRSGSLYWGRAALQRAFATTFSRSGSTTTTTDNTTAVNNPRPRSPPTATSGTPIPTSSTGNSDHTLQELPQAAEEKRVMQAPNRDVIWSRSQRPRGDAMIGPRFEQTTFEDQPRPFAAIELIHKQPVRWIHERQTSCDGGGGPLGHPRIFINVDKPQICFCTYCGVPFASEHHRKHLESLPSTSYPLVESGDAAEVQESQSITSEPLGQR